jgi:hypothetical protein
MASLSRSAYARPAAYARRLTLDGMKTATQIIPIVDTKNRDLLRRSSHALL